MSIKDLLAPFLILLILVTIVKWKSSPTEGFYVKKICQKNVQLPQDSNFATNPFALLTQENFSNEKGGLWGESPQEGGTLLEVPPGMLTKLAAPPLLDSQVSFKHPDIAPVTAMYDSWGNGGVVVGNYPAERPQGGLLRTYDIPSYFPPASTRDPKNTLVDQSICKDYAKRSCSDVMGYDRFDTCMSGQYDQCMEGRKRLVWQASWSGPPSLIAGGGNSP